MPTTDRELRSFSWLHTDRWDVDQLFNFKIVEGKQLCKMCDKWVFVRDAENHVKEHIQEFFAMNERIKLENLEKAREARAIASEEREALKIPASEFYSVPCNVCDQPIRKSGKRGRPPLKHSTC